MRTGFAQLPLHGGKAPAWLFQRRVRLARAIACHLVDEHGPDEVLARLSDPYWFQALGCVLGFDWHSSGVTTTTCGAIKQGIKGLEQDLGLYAAGGKGAASRRTPGEIEAACARLARPPEALVHASRLSAKVDSAAVQDGYQLYHHSFFTRTGRWCVVQKGLNDDEGTARRYQWLGSRIESFVNEPHAAVCCDAPRSEVLNLVAAESDASRTAIAELARTPDREVARLVGRLPTLVLPQRHRVAAADIDPRYLHRILLSTYERTPAGFETLLGLPGVGAKTLRALALIAELIYGSPASTRDPARFSFAHGGKDGTPYPVDRETYDRTIALLHDALGRATVDGNEKRQALRRLAAFAPPAHADHRRLPKSSNGA